MERNIVPEDKSYHATFTALRDEVNVILKGLLAFDIRLILKNVYIYIERTILKWLGLGLVYGV